MLYENIKKYGKRCQWFYKLRAETVEKDGLPDRIESGKFIKKQTGNRLD